MSQPLRTVPAERIRRRYDLLAGLYAVNAALGSSTAAAAIARAGVVPGERVLEIGAGTGRDLARLAVAVGPLGRAVGLEASRGMVAQAHHRLARVAGPARPAARPLLVRGDARDIPLPAGAFDMVLLSRVLDVLDSPDIAPVLGECRRVLRRNGRIALVHMSTAGEGPGLFERLFRSWPGFRGWLFVARPVRAAPLLAAAGFSDIRRVYRATFPVGSEIVTARA